MRKKVYPHVNINYLKTKDNHSFYKINHTLKSVVKLCNNKRTFPEYESVFGDEFMKDKVKLRKPEWIYIQNQFYRNNEFEWVYEGRTYRTTDCVVGEDGKHHFTNEITEDTVIDQRLKHYQYLVWNNGSVWACYINGNSYPTYPMARINVDGELVTKWTDAKNLKNFIRLRG